MPKGVKGSGTPKKVSRQPRKAANLPAEVEVRPSENLFGGHGVIIDRIILNARLASIVEKNLRVLANDLKVFDTQTDNTFGAKVLEKILHAGVTALAGLNVNGVPLPADREHGLLAQVTKKPE